MTEEVTHSKNDGGRVPPQDIVAEKSLLGALMLSNDVLPDVLTILRPRDFYEKRHQEIRAFLRKGIIDLIIRKMLLWKRWDGPSIYK